MQAEPDTALVAASRGGDPAAFGQIVERYQRAVYAVAYATTRDRALADDVTQEAFVAAWRALGELRDEARLSSWLCGIARNRARDALKHRRRQPAEVVAAIPDVAATGTPFDALGDAQTEQLIAAGLDEVPAVYREPLVLHYVENRSVEEIARQLGLDPRTTNKRLSRGRQVLAARIGELVERSLRLRGPRRDLVAGVIAAIGVTGSATHVEASAPGVAKGSIMLKLAVASLFVATLVGIGVLTSSDARPTVRPAANATAPVAPATAAPVAPRPSAPVPVAVSTPTSASTTPTAAVAARPQPRLPAAPAIPDCAAVGKHLAQVQFDAFPSSKAMPAVKRESFITQRATHYADRCAREKWSDDRRVCAIAATDMDDELACRSGVVAEADELTNLPAELGCDALAVHLTSVSTGPGGKFEQVAKLMAERGKKLDMEQLMVQLRDKTREDCERLPWALALRRCVVAGKTQDAVSACW